MENQNLYFRDISLPANQFTEKAEQRVISAIVLVNMVTVKSMITYPYSCSCWLPALRYVRLYHLSVQHGKEWFKNQCTQCTCQEGATHCWQQDCSMVTSHCPKQVNMVNSGIVTVVKQGIVCSYLTCYLTINRRPNITRE